MFRDSDLPSYVRHGDVTDARRSRHSFRFSVTACVFLVGILWLSERYLRYELTESQYIAALTLPTESARAILRSVVLSDAKHRNPPSTKYLEALAEREEEDKVLPTYENAMKLEPNNAFLAVRYGCALFQAKEYAKARECFERASHLPDKNALPKYLSAAAIAFEEYAKTEKGNDRAPRAAPKDVLAESLALVARTNAGNEPVLFPTPLWSTELPARGVWYGKLRRWVTDECCAPLYKYTDLVFAEAKHDIELRKVQYWDSWLTAIESMGQRLAEGTDSGTIQATAGVRIQLEALGLRETALRTGESNPSEETLKALAERKQKLTEALARLDAFESERDRRIASARETCVLPLLLCGESLALTLFVFFLAWLVGRILRADRTMWALPHLRGGIWLLSGSIGALLVLFAVMSIAQRTELTWHIPLVRLAWRAVILVVFVYSLFYPKLALRRLAATDSSTVSPPVFSDAADASSATSDASNTVQENVSAFVRGQRPDRWIWKAYASYWRRYWGIFAGMLLCSICVWTIGFRIAFGLYPFQVEVLVPGLESQEAHVVEETMTLLK